MNEQVRICDLNDGDEFIYGNLTHLKLGNRFFRLTQINNIAQGQPVYVMRNFWSRYSKTIVASQASQVQPLELLEWI